MKNLLLLFVLALTLMSCNKEFITPEEPEGVDLPLFESSHLPASQVGLQVLYSGPKTHYDSLMNAQFLYSIDTINNVLVQESWGFVGRVEVAFYNKKTFYGDDFKVINLSQDTVSLYIYSSVLENLSFEKGKLKSDFYPTDKFPNNHTLLLDISGFKEILSDSVVPYTEFFHQVNLFLGDPEKIQ